MCDVFAFVFDLDNQTVKIAKYLFESLPSQRRSALDLRRTLDALSEEQRNDIVFVVDAAGAVPALKTQAVQEIWQMIGKWENPTGVGLLGSDSTE